jgi:hypothetical protein
MTAENDRDDEAQPTRAADLVRRRRRGNLLIALALVVFCALAFAWIVVEIGKQ